MIPEKCAPRCACTLFLTVLVLVSLPGYLLSAPQTRQQVSRTEAPGPEITKIDPPEWWTSLPAPMLLLYGSGLEQAQVSLDSAPSGVRIDRQHPGNDGRYVFVWLGGTENVKPAEIRLRVATPHGQATVSFRLSARTHSTPPRLNNDDVIYLIMPDRFANGDPTNDAPPQSPGTFDRSKPRAYHGGDLKGVQDHLPYLKDLGVNLLWLTPIYDNDNASPESYHGYGAVDFYAVDEHLGTIQDLRSLVAAAHQQGMRLYLDNVVNHTGPRHVWTEHPPEDCWVHGTPEHHTRARSDFFALTDPHATKPQWRDTIEGWFANRLPDLNNDCPDVERYLVQNSIFWIEATGVDGFRLDTFPYSTRQFWSEWHSDLRRTYPDLSTIGEVFNSDPAITSFFQGGKAQFDHLDSGATTVFDFPLYFALRDVIIRDQPVAKIVSVLGRDRLYAAADRLVTFVGNHDVTRFITEAGSSPAKLKMAFALLATLRGIPQLYAGDEIGMQGGGDPDNRRDFPGGFPGDPRNAFTAAGRTLQENDIFDHVKAVLRLRREHDALRTGDLKNELIDDQTYVFVRSTKKEKLVVVMNNLDIAREVVLSPDQDGSALNGASELKEIFPGTQTTLDRNGSEFKFGVAPRTVVVYEVVGRKP